MTCSDEAASLQWKSRTACRCRERPSIGSSGNGADAESRQLGRLEVYYWVAGKGLKQVACLAEQEAHSAKDGLKTRLMNAEGR